MAKRKIQLTSPGYGKSSGTSAASGAGGAAASMEYDLNKDYSLAIKNAGSEAERVQLRKERQAKIDEQYGGVDPYRGTSDIMGTGKGTGGASGTADSGSGGLSAARPTSGGTSYGGSAYAGGTDYHRQAADSAARGDWDAVGRALAARQEKIDAQGGNDRGTSNAQILEQLQEQYSDSFDALSGGMQDYVKLNAGEKLPYQTGYGTTGSVYKDRGWQQGTDYLAEARRLASAGDLEGAYEALMRRGFKLADTGSSGGGTSQDQAYAMIHRLYNETPGARGQYENELAVNRQRLQEHQTQFGLQTVPALANRQILSEDGKYWVIYDGSGTPAVTRPNNGSSRKYSEEEIALMSRYYGGAEDFSELSRQLHNLAVAETGVGRLVDGAGNYASGRAIEPVRADDWTGLPQTDRYQDTGALRRILEEINAGAAYSGGPVTVPVYEPAAGGDRLTYGGYGPGAGLTSGGYYGDYGGSGGSDLAAYLRQVYQSSLDAQLASLRAAYEQNAAEYRAHDDLISQAYMSRRNQAAGQNDLERMYMAELGAARGLNTGAYGQLALAQSAAYQGSIAELLAAEGQDRAANDLALQKLTAAYRGDVSAAQARSSTGLAQALYSEYVRQAEAAQEAARWEAQMAYQREQDALAQQNRQTQWDYSLAAAAREQAYSLAVAMLKSGVLPDSATLAAAGISQSDAAALVQAYRQGTVRSVRRSTGDETPAVEQPSGGTARFSIIRGNLGEQLSSGNETRALGYLQSVWGELSAQERSDVQWLLQKYGLSYNP